MPKRAHLIALCWTLALVAVVGSPRPSFAQAAKEFRWVAGTDDWDEAENWLDAGDDPGIPGEDDTAEVDNGGTCQIS